MKWAEFAMKVQSIAKIGKLFTNDPYAQENYEELESLSLEMLNKDVLNEPTDQNLFVRDIYPTPNISVRTFVFNELNQVLLVQEKVGEEWSLPGGWCDVYESAASNAMKEVFQESGLTVSIDSVLAVFFRDKYKKLKKTLISEYAIYFKGSIISGELRPNHETIAVGFFDLDALPKLSHKNSFEEFSRALKAYESGKTEFD